MISPKYQYLAEYQTVTVQQYSVMIFVQRFATRFSLFLGAL